MEPWIPPQREFWVGEKRWLTNPDWSWWIPPQREFWVREKKMTDNSWLILADPTPKRNLVKEPWIPPRRKIRVWEQDRGKKLTVTSTKKVDLGFLGHDLKVVPQQQQQQQQQQLSPIYDLSASPQVKMSRWALTVQCGLVGSLTRVQTEKEPKLRIRGRGRLKAVWGRCFGAAEGRHPFWRRWFFKSHSFLRSRLKSEHALTNFGSLSPLLSFFNKCAYYIYSWVEEKLRNKSHVPKPRWSKEAITQDGTSLLWWHLFLLFSQEKILKKER